MAAWKPPGGWPGVGRPDRRRRSPARRHRRGEEDGWTLRPSATTLAPRPTASCTTMRPTPPAPPWTTTVSPDPTAAGLQRVHRGGAREQQAAGLLERERRRLRNDRRSGRHDLGGVATGDPVGDHLIARLHRTSGANGTIPDVDHHSRRLEAEPHRQLPLVASKGPAVHLEVDGVRTGRPHRQPNLDRPGAPTGTSITGEDLRAPEPGGHHRGRHAARPLRQWHLVTRRPYALLPSSGPSVSTREPVMARPTASWRDEEHGAAGHGRAEQHRGSAGRPVGPTARRAGASDPRRPAP